MIALVSNAVLVAADLVALRLARTNLVAGAGVWLLATAALYTGARLAGWDSFACLQALAWALFLHAPVVLAASAALRKKPVLGLLAAINALIAVDAFLIEPRWLEVTTTAVPVTNPPEPLRIALVADLQTDRIGPHERAAMDAVRAANADLVLFAGDYVHIRDDAAAYEREAAAFPALVSGLTPRLGAYAVEGDVDHADWPRLFAGTGITAVTTSTTFALAPGVWLTALTPDDSRSPNPPVPKRDGTHLVLGHAPDYALAAPPADLLLAGHIHGGQVRLPGIGPLLTLSRVPRAWAVGLTALPGGGHLYVSRGVGLERRNAPRLRFLCRPEVAILELG